MFCEIVSWLEPGLSGMIGLLCVLVHHIVKDLAAPLGFFGEKVEYLCPWLDPLRWTHGGKDSFVPSGNSEWPRLELEPDPI
jgi:hypothetical protein